MHMVQMGKSAFDDVSNATQQGDVVTWHRKTNVVEKGITVPGGSFIANGASAVTVADARVTASSLILPTLKTVGGTVGAIPAVKTITPGTGFTIAATASDTSTYNYGLFETE